MAYGVLLKQMSNGDGVELCEISARRQRIFVVHVSQKLHMEPMRVAGEPDYPGAYLGGTARGDVWLYATEEWRKRDSTGNFSRRGCIERAF